MNEQNLNPTSQTNYEKLDNLKDEEIDLTDIPELSPEMFANAIVRDGLKPVPNKQQVTLRLDSDVLEWFRARGKGYQTHINTLLRAYMEANQAYKIQNQGSTIKESDTESPSE